MQTFNNLYCRRFAIVSARQSAGTSVNLAALFVNLHNVLGGTRTDNSLVAFLSLFYARETYRNIYFVHTSFFFHFLALRSTRMVRRIFINDKLENTQRNPNSITALERIIRYGWNNARGMRASEGWERWNRESKAKELARRHYRTRARPVSSIYR